MLRYQWYHKKVSIKDINKRTSRKPLYREFSYETLNDRRWSRKLFSLRKFMKGFSPSYLQKTFKFRNVKKIRQDLNQRKS